MGSILVKSDFVGKYELAKSINDGIDTVLSQYEEIYLIDLLGYELAQLFTSDLTNHVPVTSRFLTIFNQLNDEYIRSRGIKQMMLGFIYFEYQRVNQNKSTNVGQVVNNTEVSSRASNVNWFQKYNESINDFRSIQRYIVKNKDIYPEYLGVCKVKSTPF